MKLLIVEDSRLLQRSLGAGLTNSGVTVDQAFDGLEANAYLLVNAYDVVILDLMLPKLSGLELLGKLRHRGDKTRVLILSTKGEVEDRTRGLDLGADDYLIKPFSFDELVSRLRALYRRVGEADSQIQPHLVVGQIVINTLNRTVEIAQLPLNLTPSEYKILELLSLRRQQTFSHSQLIDRLYRSDQSVTDNAIEAHVSSLRRKLRSAGADELFMTRRGFGYYIE